VFDDVQTPPSSLSGQLIPRFEVPAGMRWPHDGRETAPATDGAEANDDEPAPAAVRTGIPEPERQLWCAVIIHTLYEAAGRVAYAERGEHDQVRREAVAWFEEAGEDFAAVCDMAGFLPGAIRDNALKVIRRGRLPRMRIPKAG
jgi:hypothetical protein